MELELDAEEGGCWGGDEEEDVLGVGCGETVEEDC